MNLQEPIDYFIRYILFGIIVPLMIGKAIVLSTPQEPNNPNSVPAQLK